MTTAAALLPTRKDEDFRYADIESLARVWPVAVETMLLGEGEHRALSMVNMGVGELAIVLAPGASLDLHVLNAGQGYGRLSLRAELGAGSKFTFGAAQLAGRGQVLEVVTQVAHLGPGAASQQVVRSVAGGGSAANYLGKVHVAKGADGTDGSQSVRAMLLDRHSAANAKPELEIFADDVKCAHGCAVGELDASALFYMAQRGLPPEMAKRLMLQAFLAEAFAGAEDQEALLEQAVAALEAML
ncbi:MAG: SufD family Fe-S cluster assembly protein [Novosphingobium sp.]|uniref:SufD family Fe-S cluster assembly protein n=1 Tax=Novosphingobium sp. TaxID=1874826 RepID=UPI0032BAEF75